MHGRKGKVKYKFTGVKFLSNVFLKIFRSVWFGGTVHEETAPKNGYGIPAAGFSSHREMLIQKGMEHWVTMGVKGASPLQDSPRLRGRLSASTLCGKPKGNLAPVNAGWFRPDHVGVELGDGHVRPLQASGRAMSVSYYPAMRGCPALRGFPAVFWGHPLARGRLCAIRQSVRTDRKAFRFASICR